MSGKHLRVVTWNVLHAMDLRRGGVVDLGQVGSAIAGFGADLVALQEVDRGQRRSGSADQIGVLAQHLGWQGAFAPALLGSPDSAWTVTQRGDAGADRDGDRGLGGGGGAGAAYGVGLLSRHPISAVRSRRLPGGRDGRRRAGSRSASPGWDREPRVALSATLDLGGRPVQVTTTHLSYLPWRGLRQLAALVRSLEDLGRANPQAPRAVAGGAVQAGDGDTGGAPSVLLGDFNLPPRAVQTVARRWNGAGGAPTYPASDPRMQVDQILVRGLDVVNVRLGSPAGSDHHPLIADLLLP